MGERSKSVNLEFWGSEERVRSSWTVYVCARVKSLCIAGFGLVQIRFKTKNNMCRWTDSFLHMILLRTVGPFKA